MSLREITLTPEASELATNPAVEGLIEQIVDDIEYTPVALLPNGSDFEKGAVLEEFLLSNSFRVLPESEQSRVHRAVNIALRDEQSSSWRVEGEPASDNLLNLPTVIAKVPAIQGDSVITTGAVLLDIDRVEPGFDHQEFFESRIEFANFIGALIVAGNENNALQNSFRYSKAPLIDEQVVIGGDFHGDFRMHQYEMYPHGSVNPTGAAVPYAPVGNQRAIAAYHSVEPMILVDVLKHLHISGLSDAEQKEVVESAVATFMESLPEDGDSPFGGARFADYGSQDDRFWNDEITFFFTDKEYREKVLKRDALSDARTSPSGTRRIRTKTSEVLVFVNTYKEGDEVKEALESAVRIPTEQIGPFITALLHQTNYGMGRSSPKGLLSLLETRLSTSVV